MTIGSTSGTILIAAIPVTAMLLIEVVLPYLKKRKERRSGEDVPTTQVRSESVNASSGQVQRPSRWRQDGRYYQILYQTAKTGNIASMDKLGEFALVRKDFVEAFYWKLMVELHGGRPSGMPARNVCRAWLDAGHPGRVVEDEAGLFTEDQAKLATAVLNLWSGLHMHTPTEAIRQMVKGGQADAILFERQFRFEGT